MRPPVPGSVLAILLAALVALPATAQDATPAGTPGTDPASVTITSQETLGPDFGSVLSLSPDGRWLALVRPGQGADVAEICAYPIVTREAPTCARLAEPEVAADSVVWSPDSTRFAFTENFAVALIEPDIQIFDRNDATLTNLTDDGVSGSLADDGLEGVPTIDLAPAWSPDGSELAFARSTGVLRGESTGAETTIQRIPVDGGEPTAVTTVMDQSLAVYAGIRWLADDTIHFSVDLPEPAAAEGLWTVPAGGDEARQLVAADEIGLSSTILVDVSIGELGLLKNTETSLIGPPTVPFTIIDLATGETQPVELDAEGPINPTGLEAGPMTPVVLAAGFSPDGGSLLLAASFNGGVSLLTRDLETGADALIGQLDQPVGAPDARAGLTWGANGLVLAPSGGQTSLLFTIQGVEADG